ncbi:hypothetical protein [Deinococcus aquiradiocola]|uniref:Cytochrome c oxidase polypeptide IV n=1 Tax=Deinococcus aquiradiocola TaxID=393059 RepID=A0A917UQL6_9DEIO|nr:hypothetical protein [Deinococcus aquiradiocola]GGJ75955.1 hypothetical protein GCM10008939_20190 [Deinococcus aquiradiocola]
MKSPPDPPAARPWTLLLRALGVPAYLLLRLIGRDPAAHAPAPPEVTPAPERPGLAAEALPEGWTRPREMLDTPPTLAPVTLAFGLALGTVGVLVGAWSVAVLGAAVSLAGAALWARDALRESA